MSPRQIFGQIGLWLSVFVIVYILFATKEEQFGA